MSFEVTLSNRAPLAKLWRSDDQTPGAKRLQGLFDTGQADAYEKAQTEMKAAGHEFRRTNGKVFELFESDKTMRTPIKFQVQLGTINWYFIAPKDETHQSYRDELYYSAGIGHMSNVADHCQAYWRGTNSLHLKKMHTDEGEDDFNHNHFRIANNMDVNPEHVSQHLLGLLEAQKEWGLKGDDGKEKFVTLEDVVEISHKFNVHWVKITHTGPQKEVQVGDEIVKLPAREVSILAEYKESDRVKLTEEDIQEWEANRKQEEPCQDEKLVITKDMTLAQKIEVAKKGSRGLGSEMAETRQVEWSTRKVNKTVFVKDDQLKKTTTTTNVNPNQKS